MSTRKVIEILPSTKPISQASKTEDLRICPGLDGTRRSTQFAPKQTDYYEHRIHSNPDYKYCGIYSDSGISGAKEQCPGFQAMLKAAKAGNLDLILTKSISRFSRDTVTLLQSIRELKEAGVAVIFEEQSIHTLSAEGELMLSVLGAMAEEERKSICSNVQWAMRNKFKAGEVMVNTNRLLGYDKDEKSIKEIAFCKITISRRTASNGSIGDKKSSTMYEITIPALSGARIGRQLRPYGRAARQSSIR